MNYNGIFGNHISKKYRIGAKKETVEKTLREVIMESVTSPLQWLSNKNKGIAKAQHKFIWALKDVSMEVNRGEVIGIIGKNGSGKSTLLKILSRITKPTEGNIAIQGRVGSLLEVGTGFHKELTGRENIYLNGAILGMSRHEITRRFDEIVDFSEIEDFLDTPVKYYSSGMYTRLAFAVAAHLEPEILLVDEVLAVGDLEFQKKCLRKMQGIGESGRTVLFVSHNMSAITGLCQKAVLLYAGQIIRSGNSEEVVMDYINSGIIALSEKIWEHDDAPNNKVLRLLRVRATDESGDTLSSFDVRKPIGIELTYDVHKPDVWFSPVVQLINEMGVTVFTSFEKIDPDWENTINKEGTFKSTCWIPGNLLPDGNYLVTVYFKGFKRPEKEKTLILNEVIKINVFDSLQGDSARGKFTGKYPGVVRPKLVWHREEVRK